MSPDPPRGKGLCGKGPCAPFSGHSRLLHLEWPLITKVIETPDYGIAGKIQHFTMQSSFHMKLYTNFLTSFFSGETEKCWVISYVLLFW